MRIRWRRPRITTPRAGHVAIAAILVAVLVPASLMLINWAMRPADSDVTIVGPDPMYQFMIAVLHVGGPGLVIGWPVTALVRYIGRHSFVINALGFAAFVMLAPSYELYRFPRVELWEALMIMFGLYAIVTIGIALTIGWFRRRAEPPDIGKLTDTFG